MKVLMVRGAGGLGLSLGCLRYEAPHTSSLQIEQKLRPASTLNCQFVMSSEVRPSGFAPPPYVETRAGGGVHTTIASSSPSSAS